MEEICSLCPRACAARRTAEAGSGFCRMGRDPVIAKAMVHMWEEPCISGEKGTGAIFFSGCGLRCVFCQNEKISTGGFGKRVTVQRLREICMELIQKGVHTIDLVNPTHFADSVLQLLERPLPVPVVYNTGGYDKVETLRKFDRKVQIYLPDMKYMDAGLAARCSGAADYPAAARAAILEMYRQTGPYVLGEDGILQKGVVIRHLILPGEIENTKAVIRWVGETFAPGQVLFSLMSQYTPAGRARQMPPLSRRITREEYDEAMEYLACWGIEDGFFQELSSAEEEYIPDFDLQGV